DPRRRLVERARLRLHVQELVARERDPDVVAHEPAVDRDHLPGLRERRGAQQERVDEAEDRRRRADPEREAEHRDERERGMAGDAPDGEAQVAQDRFHIGTPSLTVAGPARCGTAGGGAHGRPASALTSYEPSRISHKNEPTTPARAPREGARALRSHKATRLSHKKAPR